jgi:hypothetical protein
VTVVAVGHCDAERDFFTRWDETSTAPEASYVVMAL